MDTLSTFITKIHAYVRNARATRRGAAGGTAVPGTHKEYPRMPRVKLPKPAALPLRLDKALSQRASFFDCASERPPALKELGTLLGNALGKRDDVRRRYPSGGGLFPIETYLIGTVLEECPSGVFHYHPAAHALEYLWETRTTFSMDDLLRSGRAPFAPVLIVFTAVWQRSALKYGDFAYDLGLLEAGHMSQNILLVATALGMSARPMGGFDDAAVSELLDLDGKSEQPIYALLLCPSTSKIQRAQLKQGETFD